MAHAFACLHYHIVFCTKNRYPWLSGDCMVKCHRYIQGVADKAKGAIVEIGGVEDHVHVLARLLPSMAPSEFVKRIKGASSFWFKESYSDSLGFAWQDGYGIFAVSLSQLGRVQKYIQGQGEHHKTQSYQAELKQLLESHKLSIADGDME